MRRRGTCAEEAGETGTNRGVGGTAGADSPTLPRALEGRREDSEEVGRAMLAEPVLNSFSCCVEEDEGGVLSA